MRGTGLGPADRTERDRHTEAESQWAGESTGSNGSDRRRAHAAPLLALVGWLEQVVGHLLDACDGHDKPVKFTAHALPDDLHRPGPPRSKSLAGWLNRNAGRREHRDARNLYDTALHLLTAQDSHVVLEAAVWELAPAVWGPAGLPVTEYQRQPGSTGSSRPRSGLRGPQLGMIQEYLVSADLSQAVGRVRPLQNDCTVFVVGNASLPGWQAEQFAAGELFDLRVPLRRDAADAYGRYAEAANALLGCGGWVTNPQVCREIGMPSRTGQGYMARYRADHAGEIEAAGHRVHRVAGRGD